MTENQQVSAVHEQLAAVLREAAATYGHRAAFCGLVCLAAQTVAENEAVGIPALACWHRTFAMTYDRCIGFHEYKVPPGTGEA